MKAPVTVTILLGTLLLGAQPVAAHNGEPQTSAHVLADLFGSAAWVVAILIALFAFSWIRSLLRGRRSERRRER